MQVCRKKKTFCQFLAAFFESRLNFEHFQTKDDSHNRGSSKITDSEKEG